MGKIKLKQRLQARGLIDVCETHDLYQGHGPAGTVESFSRGGGVHGLGSRIFRGWRRGEEAKNAVALKQLFLANDEIEEGEEVHPVEAELSILRKFTHPHLVRLDRAYMPPHENFEIWIVTDYCAGGSIAEAMLKLARPLAEPEIREVTFGVLGALAHLHKHGVTHRDVKADNILLRSDGWPILADLGSASLRAACTGNIGTSHWMAPEIASGGAYDNKVDTWSLGITLIEMAEMETPVSRDGGNESAIAIASPALHRPGKWSVHLNDLVRQSLQMDPTQRPSAEEMAGAGFFPPGGCGHAALGAVVEELRRSDAKEERARQLYHEKQKREGLAWEEDDVDDDMSSSICSRSLSQSHRPSPNLPPRRSPSSPAIAPAAATPQRHPDRERSRSSDVHFDPVTAPPDLCKDLNEIKLEHEDMLLSVNYTSPSPQEDHQLSACFPYPGAAEDCPPPPPPLPGDPAALAVLEKERAMLAEEVARLRQDLPYEALLLHEHRASEGRVWKAGEAGFFNPTGAARRRWPHTRPLEQVMLAEKEHLAKRERRYVQDLTRIKRTIEEVQGSWAAMQVRALWRSPGPPSPKDEDSAPSAARRARPQREMTNQFARPARPAHQATAMARSHTYTNPKVYGGRVVSASGAGALRRDAPPPREASSSLATSGTDGASPHSHAHAAPHALSGSGSARAAGASPLRAEARYVPGTLRRQQSHLARTRTRTTMTAATHAPPVKGGGKRVFDKKGLLVWGI